MELINTNLKGEIATLTTKTYTMKTNLFEQQNDLSSIKADQENMISEIESVESRMRLVEEGMETTSKEFGGMRGDVSTLRTGLTSLTNSLFNLKVGQEDQAPITIRTCMPICNKPGYDNFLVKVQLS